MVKKVEVVLVEEVQKVLVVVHPVAVLEVQLVGFLP